MAWYPAEGNANDIKGGNNGTLQNGATFVSGKVNQAFHFDGSNQYVLTSNTPNLSFERADAFSIDAWIRSSETTLNHFIVAKRQINAPFKGYGLILSNGQQPPCESMNVIPPGAGVLAFFVDGSDTSNCPRDHAVIVSGSTRLTDGQWHHVTVSYDGSSSASGVSLYVDGALEAMSIQSNNLGSNSIANSDLLTIGAGSSNGSQTFNGDIDELSIYNRALSSAEIQSIYNARSAGKCQPSSTPTPTPTATPTPTPTPTPVTYTISGRVTDASGKGILNVQMFLRGSGGNNYGALTDANGFYAIRHIYTDSYTLAALKQGATFQPSLHTFDNLSSDQTNVNFTATAASSNGFTISGRVGSQIGIGVSGLTLTLSYSGGQTKTTTTDSSGHYAFTNLPAGKDYQIRVVINKSTTLTKTIQNLSKDEVVDFTAEVLFNPLANNNDNNNSGRLAFVQNDGIYTMNDNGTGAAKISGDFAASNLDWSRDGSKLAFNASGGIYTMYYDGSYREQLKSPDGNPIRGNNPTWNNNGTKIAFSAYCGQGYSSCIFTANADGTNVKQLTQHGTQDNGSDIDPEWSPDGKGGIVFSQGSTYIAVMNADGSNVRRIKTTSSPLATKPSWSPDGTRIAYLASPGFIYVIGAYGSDGANGLKIGLGNSKPTWSPDGTRIATNIGIFINFLKPDGTPLQLTARSSRPRRLRQTSRRAKSAPARHLSELSSLHS